MLKKYIVGLIVVFIISGCSSSDQMTDDEETNNESNGEVYVFDEVPVDSTVEIKIPESPKPIVKKASHYLVQIGAFTTRQKAELFADKSKNIISDEILVTYRHEVNLFVVQLTEKFADKNEAVKKRNSIKIFDDFKDAWVVTVY
ncbi:MAG: SPOR domain-containing protein [Ignavibacteriales bacterium]|nr:MAG: SPOR domain-containing protein [Ignavibacteriales bacterium]